MNKANRPTRCFTRLLAQSWVCEIVCVQYVVVYLCVVCFGVMLWVYATQRGASINATKELTTRGCSPRGASSTRLLATACWCCVCVVCRTLCWCFLVLRRKWRNGSGCNERERRTSATYRPTMPRPPSTSTLGNAAFVVDDDDAATAASSSAVVVAGSRDAIVSVGNTACDMRDV